jgi:unsaturated rhamnogalacturonyl hydrolase
MTGPITSQEDELKTIAARAADLVLAHRWKLWFWGDSIGLEGLLDASELTGDEKYFGFVYGLLKGWLARERFRSDFDYTAPGVALLRVYEKTGETSLLDAAVRHANYMASFRKTTEAEAYVRYENAAIELPPELPPDHPDAQKAVELATQVRNGGPCVFVDSVHFDGPFFSKLYHTIGNEEFRHLVRANILPQIELLFDPQARLFHHFWIEQTRSRNGVLWGRGNGWGLLGLVHTLEYLPPEDLAAVRILGVIRQLANRLLELQDRDGGWHTVLNDPTSYIETSIAAFVVDGFSHALRHGWLEPTQMQPSVESAISFLLKYIREDGLLMGVSYETFPSTRVEHYRQIPRNAMVPWGQGPLLTALWSYYQMKSQNPPQDSKNRQQVKDTQAR